MKILKACIQRPIGVARRTDISTFFRGIGGRDRWRDYSVLLDVSVGEQMRRFSYTDGRHFLPKFRYTGRPTFRVKNWPSCMSKL